MRSTMVLAGGGQAGQHAGTAEARRSVAITCAPDSGRVAA